MTPFRGLVRRFLREDIGNVAILTAISLPVLVGFAGLGAETGYWFFEQRRLQASADLASYAGAVVARSGATADPITSAAETEAVIHGFEHGRGPIDVNWPPGSGSHINARSVEVLIEQSYQRSFSAVFIDEPLLINVRSVASYDEPGKACLLALDTTASQSLLFSGSATARFTACDLMSNSLADDAVTIQGAVEVTASCVNSVGGVDVTATLILEDCPTPRVNMPPALDPYAGLEPPEDPGSCSSVPGGPGNKTIGPGKYCGGMTLQGDVTLEAGVYIVSGGTLQINGNANVYGEGVTFYLTDGAGVQMNGTANIDLTAPTTGDYSGMLMFADPDSPGGDARFNGTADSSMVGALYFPTQHVAMLGDFSGSGGCTRIVAETIEVRGNPDFSADCTGTGINDPGVPGAVRLVE